MSLKYKPMHTCDRCGDEQIEPFKYEYVSNSLGLKFSIIDFKQWFKSLFANPEFKGFDGNYRKSYDMCKSCARKYLEDALESLDKVNL